MSSGDGERTELPLGEVAHARAGDKGDSAILMIAAHDPARAHDRWVSLTPAAVAAHFGTTAEQVTVTPVPALGACSIVVHHALEGGVTRSLRLDPHGKTLAGHLLELTVAWTA